VKGKEQKEKNNKPTNLIVLLIYVMNDDSNSLLPLSNRSKFRQDN
jgi:hypothetical protein